MINVSLGKVLILQMKYVNKSLQKGDNNNGKILYL